MTHRDEQQWLAYIRNELPESEREQAEAHLYSCDSCLARWEQMLTLLDEAELPLLGQQRGESLTNAVMAAVAQHPVHGLPNGAAQSMEQEAANEQIPIHDPLGKVGVVSYKRRQTDGRRRAFLHYAIAVCVTLLLMSTGLWKAFNAGMPAIAERDAGGMSQHRHQQQAAETYTQRMMNHTVGLLEHWTEKAAGSEADSRERKGMGS